MDAVLTTYPLSEEFVRRLDGVLEPEAVRLSVVDLRQVGWLTMLRRLRAVRVDRIFLPLEDENARALAPVLLVLAALTRARAIFEISPDLERQHVRRTSIAGLILHLAAASIFGRLRAFQCRREIEGLLRTERTKIDRPGGRNGLFLNANLWFGVKAGGSVGHISGVINGFLKGGFRMSFASAGGRMLVAPEARFEPLPPPKHFGIPWEVNFYRFHFAVVRQILALAAHEPIDFIYQRLSLGNYSGVQISRRLKIPLILEYNGSEAWVAKNWGRPLRYQKLAEQVEDACLHHAHLVVTISEVLRDELLGRGIPAERIIAYPNCIDPEFINPGRFTEEDRRALRESLAIPADAVIATFLGTFGQWHGAETFARAIRKLCDEDAEWLSASKLHFMLVGNGTRMPAVLEALGSHAHGPHVTLAGLVAQREAPGYLAASDILVSPHVPNADGTPFFGSPTKLFEYMAMERAILASDLDQIGEILTGSRSVAENNAEEPGPDDQSVALLTTPGSAEEIALGLKYLVAWPAWRRQIAVRARSLALDKYTWTHHVDAIVQQARNVGILA